MLVVWPDAFDFERRARNLLVAKEATHSMFWSVLRRVRQSRLRNPTLALVTTDNGAVVSASVDAPPLSTLLTAGPAGAVEALAHAYAGRGHELVGVRGPADSVARFAATWVAAAGGATRAGHTEIVYELDQAPAPPAVAGRHRRARSDDATLLMTWTRAFRDEAALTSLPDIAARVMSAVADGVVHLWERDDDTPVSMAWEVGSSPNGARVGCVFTPPDERGRGYARAVTASLSAQLLARGRRFCCLHADETNTAANRVYTSVGYREVARLPELFFSR